MSSTNPFDPSAPLAPLPPPTVRDEQPLGGAARAGLALVATYAGLKAFGMVWGYFGRGRPQQLGSSPLEFLLAPLAAGVTIAVVFKVLEYATGHRHAGVPVPVDHPMSDAVEAGAPTVVRRAARAAPQRASSSGAWTAFFTVTGVAAAIGALFFGAWGYAGDSGPSPILAESVERVVTGVIFGVLLGGGIGTLIGIPAAALIWMTRRRP